MLANKESISRLAIYKLGSSLQISEVKRNESVTMYSFLVKGVKDSSKTFASL